MSKVLLAAAGALLPLAGWAAQVSPASMTASAQMQVSGGSLDGCGLRVIAVAQDSTTEFEAADFSFNFYKSGQSLVKAGIRVARLSNAKEASDPPVRPIASFWIRAVGKPATTPTKVGVLKSDSPKGYLLYGTSADAVAELFGAVFEQRPIQVGLLVLGEKVERVFSGTVRETNNELRELSQCLDELTAGIAKEAQDEEAKGK